MQESSYGAVPESGLESKSGSKPKVVLWEIAGREYKLTEEEREYYRWLYSPEHEIVVIPLDS